MKCPSSGVNKVKCEGKISAQYGAKKNEFPLVTYRVVQEDGEWKWCGVNEVNTECGLLNAVFTA